MTSLDQQLLDQLQRMRPSLVAIEALWDGDTHGWYVILSAVVVANDVYSSRVLEVFRSGGDIRIFQGAVPPWPEAIETAAMGQRLAEAFGVPFHFPSPEYPEDQCPHWYQLAESYSCRRCAIPLLQPLDCPWRGVCFHCHLELEREAREAR
jgi:hypothetical protein